ncbi:hypothetical protein [Streptomyces sp. B6B3]|uniref:hypothetical protein n=1 Tax=Streptomyces sp. B6B3 TaxID=3153570 RepID=UPI00325CBBF9
MLTISGRGTLAIRLLTVTALAASVVVLLGLRTTATADPNCSYQENAQGQLVYVCEDTTPGEDGDNGDNGSGSGEPTCDLSLVEGIGKPDASRWCQGSIACWANIPAVLPEEEWPDNPPSEDHEYIYKSCVDASGNVVEEGWEWYNPDEPSIEELVQQAYGNLQAPEFTLAFSPPTESVIYIDTWWWAEGATNEEIIGTAALGVRAVAEPDHMEVDPGDGSGTITCDFSVSESDECSYVYERASDGYPARARLVYDVRFEQNGNPLEVAGMPETFESNWYEATVPVTEVQANVVR